ncbi:MAG: acyl carrier protein [Gammaproteobacteria bacterium]|nr:acyl carrier protein [Gammaproteobacteria bacterium]
MNAVRHDDTDLRAEVRNYLRENFLFGEEAPRLGDEESLIGRHVLDSTGFLELVAFLESRFGVRIEDPEMTPENLDAIASIATLVQGKLAGADSGGRADAAE